MKEKISRREMFKFAGSLGAASLVYVSGGILLPGQRIAPKSTAMFFSHGNLANASEIGEDGRGKSELATGKKVLIIYASRTGNTKKVAYAFHDAFLKAGWTSDIFRITKKTKRSKLPFNLDDYDALFVGSGTYWRLPYDEITKVVLDQIKRSDIGESKIVPGPKVGVAFATNGGAHLGPKEAEANLKLLEIDFEHLGFKGVGAFSCPGNLGGASNDDWYWGDISDRPNDQDLADAASFVKRFLQLDEVKAL
jgi:flavodoxin